MFPEPKSSGKNAGIRVHPGTAAEGESLFSPLFNHWRTGRRLAITAISSDEIRTDSRAIHRRTDITDSVREQQGMLNVVASTFELMGVVNIRSRRMTMYTRQTVQENLSPYILDEYNEFLELIADIVILLRWKHIHPQI
ncbi:MAG: hypothetical protein ACLTW9_30720 [Enterocloster sp.]